MLHLYSKHLYVASVPIHQVHCLSRAPTLYLDVYLYLPGEQCQLRLVYSPEDALEDHQHHHQSHRILVCRLCVESRNHHTSITDPVCKINK